MAPKRKVPANLAAARAKRHPMVEESALQEEPMDQENLSLQSTPVSTTVTVPASTLVTAAATAATAAATAAATSAATSAATCAAATPMDISAGGAETGCEPCAPPPPAAAVSAAAADDVTDATAAAAAAASTAVYPKPRGYAPKVGEVDATWDERDGCWRAPDGSEHHVPHNKKAKAVAEGHREACLRIDGEAAAAGAREAELICTFKLEVPESCRRLLKAPQMPGGGTYGGGVATEWYATVRAAFEEAIDGGCEMQPEWGPPNRCGSNPLGRATQADRDAVEAMLALRRRCVAWLLEPAQLQLVLLEPQFCATFGQYAAERLRACPEPLQVLLRAEAGLNPTEWISDTKAEFMLATCAALRAAPLCPMAASEANSRANQ